MNTLMTECRNCSNKYSGDYCNQCSQPASVRRITWKEIIHSVAHALFHADKGLWHTIIELTLRPGKTLNEYIEGKRIVHVNPLVYLLLTGGLATFLFFNFHVKLPVREIRMEEIASASQTVAHKYFALVGLIFILLLTASDYLFYRSSGYNFPELLICNTFQAGHLMLLTILMFPLLYLETFLPDFKGIDGRWLLKAVIITYLIFTRNQMFHGNNYWISFLKIAFQIIMVYLLYDLVLVKLLMRHYGFA